MSKKSSVDHVFNHDRPADDFQFNNAVANVFDDMVSRSVPFYQETQRMVVELAASFVQPKTRVFDLGCSTANTMIQLAESISDKSVKIVGIDNSPAMIEKSRAKLTKLGLMKRCELRCQDLVDSDIDLSGASVIMMNYTMQFVRPLYRDALLARLYDGLINRGCFLMVEKVLANESILNRLYIDLYYNFKKRKGYSELEISKKREALENVLIPYRVEEDMLMLKRSNFQVVDMFVRWYNFAGFIAIKHNDDPRA